jgi:4-amino-4-deoxy-L-arabinose transferase-like glycosyltransferase
LKKREKGGKPGPTRSRESYQPLWKHALIIFLVALAFRGAYLFEASRRPDFNLFYMDEEYHLEWAKGLATGVWNPPYDQIRDAPYFRAPLYPYFLAGLLRLSGGNTAVVRVIQIILGSLSCILAYMLATCLFGRRAGLVTGVLCSCYWVLAYFDTQLLLPVLLVFLLLAGMLAAFVAARSGSLPLAGLAGLAFGLYSVTRPNIVVFFPFLVWWTLSLRKRQQAGARRWFAVLLLIGMIVPPAVATIRNRVVGKNWVFIASQGGVNFYIGNNPQSDGMQAVVPGTRQTWWGGYEDTKAIAEKAAGRALKPSEVSDYWLRRAFEYIRDDPLDWARLTLRKIGAFVGDVELPNNEPYDAYRREFISLRAVPLGFALLFGLFLVSLPFQARIRKQARSEKGQGAAIRGGFITLTLVLAATYTLTVIAFFVTGRYRVPLIPFFAMGASVTAIGVYDLLVQRAFLKALATTAIAAAVVAALHTDYLGARRATQGFTALTMAQDHLDTGDVGGAITALEKIRREGSVRAAEVYLTLARAYIQRGSPQDRDAAFMVAEEGLKAYPTEPELLWYSAVGYASRQDWPMVKRRIASLLDLEPQNMRGIYLGFTAALETGDTTSAQGYLDRAIATQATDPLVGEMQDRLGRPAHP